MTITLSSVDLERLQRAGRLLISPFEYGSANEWRSAVNVALRQLLDADSAGFLLPGGDGPLLYSDEHDPDQLGKYPDLYPPSLSDGTTIWERLIASRVSTMSTAYGRDVHLYTESAYYNEYASPNGAHDTLCAMLPLMGASGSPGPTQVASVQLWHERASDRWFGERERRMLALLFPAFAAGVELQVRWRQQRAMLLNSFDALGHAVQVISAGGRLMHETPALTAVLAADPEAGLLRAALHQTASSAGRTVARTASDNCVLTSPLAREVRTREASYRVRASLYGLHAERQPIVLVALERLTPVPLSPEELRKRFGLTIAEGRVALLLAQGCANLQIADALSIRPSTARRHTERVLQKLGVRSRAEVGPRLARGA